MAKKNSKDRSGRLFIEASGQRRLLDKSLQEQIEDDNSGGVECLGQRFESDQARRDFYVAKLKGHLADPAFRAIEGFPKGSDENILRISDPPYYTACPNPFIKDFLAYHAKTHGNADNRGLSPFASDVSEGKNEAIYNAHRYHTKVPPRAIVRYILHYTRPGDVVLDGFSGSGMTGVGAQMCASRSVVESLGLSVDRGGNVTNPDGSRLGQLGARVPVLVDLSPIATFITYNQNVPCDTELFRTTIEGILNKAKAEYGWLYTVPRGRGTKELYHTVWSEVLICASCQKPMVFWEVAVNLKTGDIAEDLQCPHCKATSPKRSLERATERVHDPVLNKTVSKARYTPVGVRFIERGAKRIEEPFTKVDEEALARVRRSSIPFWYPTASIERDIDMWYERDYRSLGLFTLDGFYTDRNLLAFSYLWDQALRQDNGRVRTAVLFNMTAMIVNLSRMNCWRYDVSFPYNPISGTLYVPALPVESNVFLGVENKAKRLARIWDDYELNGNAFVSTQSCGAMNQIPDNSIDYIFTDPPFGSNIIYSDLSLLYEGWLRVETNTDEEAVVHRRKDSGNTLTDYREMMTKCFTEYVRVLKPGHWLTMVFHNTKNAVWNAIQEALQRAGFVVADVRILDKGQGSFKQLTAAGAVRQDLVISAYKPSGQLADRFKLDAGTEEGVWEFVRSHLACLPEYVEQEGLTEQIVERQNFLLFDRMVAFHVQRGVAVPLSAGDFYAGLAQRFPERDGMYFLPAQAAEYDRRRTKATGIRQLTLFITDEASAIQWLRQQLGEKPQTFKEIQPQFMKEIAGWEKHERPLELLELLRQNFISYDGVDAVPNQIHAYLSSNFKELRNLSKTAASLREKAMDRWYVPDPNKAGDLEKLRERTLLAEFEEYKASKQRNLRVFRTEAVRAGFKAAYDRQDYKTIVAVAARLPESVLQEDEKLLMYYDVATMRLGDEGKDKLFQ